MLCFLATVLNSCVLSPRLSLNLNNFFLFSLFIQRPQVLRPLVLPPQKHLLLYRSRHATLRPSWHLPTLCSSRRDTLAHGYLIVAAILAPVLIVSVVAANKGALKRHVLVMVQVVLEEALLVDALQAVLVVLGRGRVRL